MIKRTSVLWAALIFVLAGMGIFLLVFPFGGYPAGKLDAFAKCLKDKGAIFYGAFWCPHCRNQKAMFGSSAGLLPYIECSAPDGRGQLPVCNSKGVTSYPTWMFTDGSRLSGEIPLGTLAEKTGCSLPENK